MELNSAYLASCNVEKSSIGPFYLCQDGLTVLSNDVLTTSCLGTLFSGNYDEKILTNLCDVKVRDIQEYWQQVDVNVFMIYSKEPIKLTKTCPSPSPAKPISNISIVENLQLVIVEPGCIAYTNSFSLYGKTEINLERNFIYLPQKVTFTDQIFDPVHLEQVYKDLGELSLPSAVHFRELQIYEKTNAWRKHSLSVGGALLIVAMVLGLCIVGYLAFTYWKFRRSRPAVETIEMMNR
jgi:cbb3-type cytochrome oxidase subunit 3